MGIEKFLLKISVQTAVYWANPTDDGYGGITYDDPVEISVRWENKTKLITTADGQEYTCLAEVIINQDVDVNGYLYLGTLDDLTVSEQADPKTADSAYRIRRFDKIPMIKKTDEFVRKVYL
jgi:hypothetical protein